VLGVGAVLPAVLSFLIAGCNAPPPQRPKKPADVVVTTPVLGMVVDYQDFTGRLDGFRTVDVKARVSGYITEAPFKEGDHVNKGDLLFQIDPRPYQIALKQAEAQVRLQQAQLEYQEALYARNVRLNHEGQAVSLEDVQQSRAQRDTTAAQLEAAHQTVDNAKLNLEWSKVTSPLTGRVSRRQMDPGNLVVSETSSGSTALTTVVSDNQLYAYFDVDERTYLNLVTPYQSGSDSAWLTKLQFPVLMSLANEGGKFEHVGIVDFIDNRVVGTTGTIRMRGVFDNADGLLKAGLFGHFRLPLGKPYQAVLVSGEAVQYDQGRNDVYVVSEDNKVVYRPVTLGQELKGMWVVKEGLQAGEHVIVSGMQRVHPGAEVEAKMQDPPPVPESPLVPLLAKQESGVRSQESGVRGRK
jgi:RND family efflux transporter MFP subunit